MRQALMILQWIIVYIATKKNILVAVAVVAGASVALPVHSKSGGKVVIYDSL